MRDPLAERALCTTQLVCNLLYWLAQIVLTLHMEATCAHRYQANGLAGLGFENYCYVLE